MKCVSCKKEIGSSPSRKFDSVISGQGTRRNFRPQSFGWCESCWQAEKAVMDFQDAQRAAEREKEISEAGRQFARGRASNNNAEGESWHDEQRSKNADKWGREGY
jgi:hypothetical protein